MEYTTKGFFKKSKIAMRYWLLGRNYNTALKAMELGLKCHSGKRKDSVTPEFQHQLSIANYAKAFEPTLLYSEETLAVIFLHDVLEDCDITSSYIKNEFGERIQLSVMAMTKKYENVKKDIKQYHHEISQDPIASLTKPWDRINNIQTMVNVFTEKGQKWYIEETENFILPSIKKARRLFIQQESIYMNAKVMLCNQMDLIKLIHTERGMD